MATETFSSPEDDRLNRAPVYLTVGNLRQLVKTLDAHDDDLICIDVLKRNGECREDVNSLWVTDCIWEIRRPGPHGRDVDVLRLHAVMEEDTAQ